jgi:response regulator NasT
VVEEETQHLRVLIANERRDRLELLAGVVAGLGHEVIAREVEVGEVGTVTARERLTSRWWGSASRRSTRCS